MNNATFQKGGTENGKARSTVHHPRWSRHQSQDMVTVEAACSKHRRKDVLPLHPELVDLLREWLAGLDPGTVLFP
jgi:hypothetical protein